MNAKQYNDYVETLCPKSPMGKDICFAFLIGGAICLVGQAIMELYKTLGMDQETASMGTSITLIFLSAFFTALGVYDDLAKIAGAGTLVPITGFANAVVSPAVEFKSEGFVLGVSGKMFTIAGPVLVFGITSASLYGVIYWISTSVL